MATNKAIQQIRSVIEVFVRVMVADGFVSLWDKCSTGICLPTIPGTRYFLGGTDQNQKAPLDGGAFRLNGILDHSTTKRWV